MERSHYGADTARWTAEGRLWLRELRGTWRSRFVHYTAQRRIGLSQKGTGSAPGPRVVRLRTRGSRLQYTSIWTNLCERHRHVFFHGGNPGNGGQLAACRRRPSRRRRNNKLLLAAIWFGAQEVIDTDAVVRGAATATAPGIEVTTRFALTANAAAAAAAAAAAPAAAAAKRVRLSGRS